MFNVQIQQESERRKLQAAEQSSDNSSWLETRQKQLADERCSLETQIQEATASAAASQESQAAVVASLASEVEELRWG